MEKVKVIAGLDIGNGYVKGKVSVNDRHISKVDMVSMVAYTTGSDIPVNPTASYIADLHNNLDVTMVSKGIKSKDNGRVFFGTRGVLSGEGQTEFNIDNHEPKCNDSLSTMLVIGSIAASAVQEYWNKYNSLPTETIQVDAYLGVALPIEDYITYKDMYVSSLKQGSHHVHIHNFDKAINVEIHFKNVAVLAEGAAAQFAITNLGAEFLQTALDHARAEGAAISPYTTGAHLVAARDTIGIDIGEGTTNFPVFVNGDISIESSRSINKGIGSVYSAVLLELRNSKYAFPSRKALSEFMLKDHTMATQQRIKERVQRCIDKHTSIFVRSIMTEFSSIFGKKGKTSDAIYVYGGGASTVKKYLYPLLIEEATLEKMYDTDSPECYPVLYLDSSFSRDLNRNGLFEAAQLVASLDSE